MKIPWQNILIGIGIVLVVGGWFYWFAWRPVQIRKDCAWVHVQIPAVAAIPPDPSVVIPSPTQEPSPTIKLTGLLALTPYQGDQDIGELIRKKNGTPRQPAQDYWTAASDDQYKSCLREAGQ